MQVDRIGESRAQIRAGRTMAISAAAILLWAGAALASHDRPQNELSRLVGQMQEAVGAHKDRIATQDLVFHFSDGVMDVHTESKKVPPGAFVTRTSQVPRTGTSPRTFCDLPATIVNPLQRLPNQFEQQRQRDTGEDDGETSVSETGKTTVRLLPSEKVRGSVYKVLEFTQYPPQPDYSERVRGELACTRIVGKLYIGKDGLVHRKSGRIWYRPILPEAETSGKNAGTPELSVTFASTKIEYGRR